MAKKHVSGKHDNTQEQVNELKIGNLPEKELKSLDSEDDARSWNKIGGIDKEVIKDVHQRARKFKEQTEMNSIITEMKNALEGSNSRKTKGEEQISDLTDRMVEITVMEQKKRMKRNEDS